MNTALRWVALGALFIIPFLPLYVDGSLFFPFISSKGFAFRILVEIATAAWILLALSDPKYRPQWSWTFLIYTAFVGWMFVANLFAVNPYKAFWSNFERMDGWVTMIHVFLFFVVSAGILAAEKRWRAWWLTVLAVSVAVAGHGLLQLLCAGQECAKSFPIHQGGVRVDANLGNAAYLAAYLLFIIAVALWQAVISKGLLRYALLLLTVVHVCILFSTATRGAILGLVGAVGLGAVLWLLTAGKAGRKIGIGVLAALVVVVSGFILIKDTPFVREDPTLTRIASISLETAETRLTLWGMALKGVAERPVTGWGQEGYIYIFSKYYEPSLYAQEPWFDRAHSVYFDWLVAGGWLALFLFLGLLASGVLALYRSDLPRAEKVFLIAAIGAYAFQALFVFDNLFTYVLLAAILAIAHHASAKPIRGISHVSADPTLTTIAAPIAVVVILCGSLWVVNINNVLAGKELIQAAMSKDVNTALGYFNAALSRDSFATQEIREQLITFAGTVGRNASVPPVQKQETFLLALTQMEEQLRSVPLDARVLSQYAQGLEQAGEYEGALAALTRATELAPKKQLILLQKGTVNWRMKDYPAARATFEEAYALDPSFDEAGIYAAAGHVLTGDSGGAKAFLLERFGTTTINHDIIRFAYYEVKQYDELILSARLRTTVEPENVAAWFQLAQAYAEAGRRAEARAVIEAVAKQFPDQAPLAAQFLKELDALK